MASLDPVALDTAEAALAGYELSSIPILPIAAQNGLGQGNPALIRIEGNAHFSLHRQFLWHTYNEGGNKRYPLEDGWGGARALTSVEPTYSVEASTPEKTAENVYDIKFRVVKNSALNQRKVIRVELAVGGTVILAMIGDDIEQSHFVLDLNRYPDFLNTDFTYNVFAWDDTFNCVSSIERFIFKGQ